MSKELKIRISDPQEIEERLEELGATFDKELAVTDTYFEGQGDDVLKITEDDEGDFLVELSAVRDGFEIERYEELDDVDTKKQELAERYGVKAVLEKRRRFWHLGDRRINLNIIEDVGDFLVVEADNPTKEFIEEDFCIENPHYVTVPFSDLVDR